MATRTRDRVIIYVLAGLMLVGTVGAFAAIIVANENQPAQTAREQEELQRQIDEQQRLAREQAAQRAEQLRPLDGFEATSFTASDVTERIVETLEAGSGEAATRSSNVSANYFGWTSDGTIFDSTKLEGQEAVPASFSLAAVIEGWREGLNGVREGTTVRLTIPAAQAYGASGSPPLIGPDEPLKFIVTLEEVEND